LTPYISNIDGAGKLSTQQRIAHSYAHIHSDIALRLRGRRADMWCEHHFRPLSERMICRQGSFS